MTVHLVNACREVDDLLLECLLTWSEVTGQERDKRHLAPLHRHYAARSAQLIEARAAIEVAFRALEGQRPEPDPETPEASPDVQTRQAARAHWPVCIEVGCDCTVLTGSLHVSGASSSRPDRPQRPQEQCRGQIRDWNRDILACRVGSNCGHEAGGLMALSPGNSTQAGTFERGRHAGEGVETVGPDSRTEAFRPGRSSQETVLEPQTAERAYGKDLDNGEQTSSARPRKRG